MQIVRIVGKNTGLGNQIQFIPVINELKKQYRVISDSWVFSQLGVLEPPITFRANINITIFGYDVLKFWEARAQYAGKFHGYKYRVKKRHIGFGYSKSLRFDEYISEIENNRRLYNYCFGKDIKKIDYYLPGRNPEPGTVILGISPKPDKALPIEIWKEVKKGVHKMGFKVREVDNDIGLGNFVETPTLADLKDTLSKAEYFIGTDSGVMHLADILGTPSLIMFGSTSIAKNRPVLEGSKVLSRNLECSPCYDWGRVNCPIDFECMKFQGEEIVEEFKSIL